MVPKKKCQSSVDGDGVERRRRLRTAMVGASIVNVSLYGSLTMWVNKLKNPLPPPREERQKYNNTQN